MSLLDIVGACIGFGIIIATVALSILEEKEKQERESSEKRN